jgi:hypothetical protein
MKGCFMDDGLYAPQEARYRRSALKEAGAFDLGVTYELFGNAPRPSNPKPEPGERMLIASKRFCEFCVKHKLKMDGHPLRVDEG